MNSMEVKRIYRRKGMIDFAKDLVLLFILSSTAAFLLVKLSFYEHAFVFMLRYLDSPVKDEMAGLMIAGSVFLFGLIFIGIRQLSVSQRLVRLTESEMKGLLEKMEEKKLEAKELDTLFKTIGEQSHDAIEVINREGKIIYWNAAAAKLYGYARGERELITVFDLIPEGMHEEYKNRLMHFFTLQSSAPLPPAEFQAKKKNGEIVHVEAVISIIDYKNEKHILASVRDIDERRALEQKARDLSHIVEEGSMPIVVTDQTGIIRFVNKAWQTLTGWSAEEVLGKATPRILKSGKQEPAFYQNLWRTILAGDRFQAEFVNRRKDGASFTVDQVINSIKDETGSITGYVGFLHDLSHRKQMTHNLQERVKELNALYRLASMTQEVHEDIAFLLEQIPDIIKQAFQYPHITEVKLTVFEKVYATEQFKEAKWKMMEPIQVRGKHIGSLTVVYTEEKPLLDFGPFFAEEKRLMAGIATLLTHYIDHAEDEKVIRETTERLDAVLHSMPDTVFILDETGICLQAYTQNPELLPMPLEEMIGVHINIIFDPKSSKAFLTMQKKTLEERSLMVGEQILSLHAGKRWFEVRMYPLKRMQGGKRLTVMLLRDIHGQKVSEGRRIELERLKSQFISTLTHSTRTPLTELRWGIEGILAGDYGQVSIAQQSHLRQLLQSEKRILRLVTNIDLALNIERGGVSLKRQPASLVVIASLVKKDFDRECATRNLACDIEAPKGDLPSILVDRELMQVVFEILIDNAVRFSKKDSTVKLTFSSSDEWVHIAVSDQGIGIPEEEHSYVFDRFYRASNAGSVYADGIGLGLSIAKSIVEMHGGTLTFESVLNHGSTFTVSLPRNLIVEKRIDKKE